MPGLGSERHASGLHGVAWEVWALEWVSPSIGHRTGVADRVDAATNRCIRQSDTTPAPFQEAWRQPLAAGRGEVTVWIVPVGAHRQFAAHARVLGRDDWSAIARIRDLAARDHARATRIALRLALTQAVDGAVAPAAWTFETTSYGKPRVAEPHPDVHFNVSHNETMTVIAVSRDQPVGLDIETIAGHTSDDVMAATCSPRELRRLQRLGGPERQRAFKRLWTLKEAYTKLIGTGLAADVRSLEFEIVSEQQIAGHEAQYRLGEASLQSWLTEAPGGLCQVSIAIGACDSARRSGELVCLAVGADGDIDARTPQSGRGCGARLVLS